MAASFVPKPFMATRSWLATSSASKLAAGMMVAGEEVEESEGDAEYEDEERLRVDGA